MTKTSTHYISSLFTWFLLVIPTLLINITTVTADSTQVCTLDDATGQEICVEVDTATVVAAAAEATTSETTDASSQPGSLSQEEICLPDGHCWDGLEVALASQFTSNNVEGTHVSLTKPVPFGDAQLVGGNDRAKTVQVLADTYQYMVKVYNNETTKSFRDGCHCRNELCAFWAAIGELSA
jgi:hypothetical protein